MTIRVLTDYAHGDLWESMVRLFEDRFGWELYRPIGMDWYPDVWRFEHDRLGDVVARQFLAQWNSDRDAGAHSERDDLGHPGRVMKMVTTEQARSIGFDLVIATLAENEEGLHRFAGEIGAHFGIQVGNQGAPNAWGLAEFALLSVTTPGFRPWMPHVTYHQEFDLDLFRFDYPPAEPDLVATRVQCITGTPEYKTFRQVAELVPQARFRHYGHCGDQDDLWGGDAPTTPAIAQQMRATRIGWHAKRWSDGYGHVGFNWFAVGRPVIGTARYYADKLMAPLWVEGETSFDIDSRTDHELADLVRKLLDDHEFHQRVSENAARRFRDVVNFAGEAERIRAMLDGILSDRVVAA